MCFAVLSLLLLLILQLPKSSKFFVHKNLIFVLGICDFILGVMSHDDLREKIELNKIGCVTMFVFAYYWNLALNAWMSVEAFNICMKLSAVFDTRSKFKTHMWYLLFGYCCPGIITTVVSIVFYDQILDSTRCLSLKDKYVWVYKGPLAAYLVLITLAFMYIFGLTCKHIFSGKKYKGGFRKFLASIRTFLVLYPILGVGQTLFLYWEYAPIALAWVAVLTNSFLAVLFFILHVMLDDQVQEAVVKKLGIKRNNANFSNATSRMRASQASMTTTATICESNVIDNAGLNKLQPASSATAF